MGLDKFDHDDDGGNGEGNKNHYLHDSFPFFFMLFPRDSCLSHFETVAAYRANLTKSGQDNKHSNIN